MAGGDRLRVDRGELADVLAHMDNVTRSIDDAIADIDQYVNRLHVTWSGEAATKQAEAHAKWSHAARQMHEALADLHKLGTTAHSNYDAAVDANLTMWRR